MTTKSATWLVLLLLAAASISIGAQSATYPRTLAATAAASGAGGAITGTLTIHLERLMNDRDFKTVADALKYGGYPGFLPALRELPAIGYVKIGERQVEIKYARERAGAQPRLVLGTDHPVFFVGAGTPDAKPKAGYEVAVIELDVDAQGNGQGTMAAAARVRPAPDGGVILDDYASAPVQLSLKPAR